MGERLQLRLYRGVSELRFRKVADAIASKVGGSIAWDVDSPSRDSDFRTAASDGVYSVYLPYLGGVEYLFCAEIGKVLDAVWMELHIQEGSLWDYSLYQGDSHLHCFSTLPTYWSNDRKLIKSQRGDIDELVRVWRCDKQRVANYLKQWKMKFPWYSHALGWMKWLYTPPMVMSTDHWYFRLFGTYETLPRGKAYESDEHEYGDIWQIHDFMRALGAADPLSTNKGAKQHAISLPDAKTFNALI